MDGRAERSWKRLQVCIHSLFVAGAGTETSSALEKLDLDGDWDPDSYDKQMTDIYGMDDDGAVDDEKPHWDDDIDIGDIVPEEDDSDKQKKKKKKKKTKEEKAEDGVDVDEMDADVERAVDDEEWDGTEEMRKRKLDEYMDEIYGLEFNDMVCSIGSRREVGTDPVPCRSRVCRHASSTPSRRHSLSVSLP